MIEIQMTVSRIPCKADSARPCVAALLAVSLLPAPRQIAICELIPIPKPIAIAFEKFCTGKTSDSAVMASSLIWATKKLSTILYRELTSMEMTIGIAMDKISGKTGRSFINVSFITNLHNSIKLVSVKNIHKKTPHNYRKG